MSFKVRKHRCKTCIFGSRVNWNLEELLDMIRDPENPESFTSYRVCHDDQDNVPERCCRGFWDKHRNDFLLGRVAQIAGVVKEVD